MKEWGKQMAEVKFALLSRTLTTLCNLASTQYFCIHVPYTRADEHIRSILCACVRLCPRTFCDSAKVTWSGWKSFAGNLQPKLDKKFLAKYPASCVSVALRDKLCTFASLGTEGRWALSAHRARGYYHSLYQLSSCSASMRGILPVLQITSSHANSQTTVGEFRLRQYTTDSLYALLPNLVKTIQIFFQSKRGLYFCLHISFMLV